MTFKEVAYDVESDVGQSVGFIPLLAKFFFYFDIPFRRIIVENG
jgi:hypothetical protein